MRTNYMCEQVISAMVWRLRNPILFKNSLCKSWQSMRSENFSMAIKNLLIDDCKFGNARRKSFSCTKIFSRGAERFGEKLLPGSMNDYTKFSIQSASLDEKLGILTLNFEKADGLEFPVIWLRDNCQCHECFDATSNSRVHGPLSFTNDIIPKSVTSSEDSLTIIWEDGHSSLFEKKWLCRRSFQAEHQIERLNEYYIKKIPWNAEDFQKLLSNICFKFDDIINDDNFLLKWLETLATVGIAKIFDAPLEPGQLVKLTERVSHVRKTHYGEEYYIKGDADANNVAYQRGPLQMHTDLPYYQYVPGVVLLHFIMQSQKGGDNIITDGLNAVEQLPRRMYNILANTFVDWSDIGCEKNKKFHSMNRAPVLCENELGQIERINWSQPQRDSTFNVAIGSALEWYEAFQEFSRIMHDPKNTVILKNFEGTILSFDNRRILHGRTDYKGKRFLCGAYIDWDEIHSRIRVLKQQNEVVDT